MKKSSRIVAAVAALVLMLSFVLPLWKITLGAPQYPEGLGMKIRVHTIEGIKPNDLQNINGLNHYIGMARIEPESIPELRYMPWILGALVALGLATAVTGNRKILVAWTLAFGLAAGGGLYDFWRWEYNYGHNLNPMAAIKVPGLSYQPPLIGSTQLLNFTANSWPAAGGIIAIAAFLTTVGLTITELRRRQTKAATAAISAVPKPDGTPAARSAPVSRASATANSATAARPAARTEAKPRPAAPTSRA